MGCGRLWGWTNRRLPLRDPAGNLIEIDWADVTTLDCSRLPELKRLADSVPQTGDALRATLYLQKAEL